MTSKTITASKLESVCDYLVHANTSHVVEMDEYMKGCISFSWKDNGDMLTEISGDTLLVIDHIDNTVSIEGKDFIAIVRKQLDLSNLV